MFQRFLTDTIESKFIKNLLATTQIPIYKSVSVGDYIVKDGIYLFENHFIKCLSTGVLVDIESCPLLNYDESTNSTKYASSENVFTLNLELDKIATYEQLDEYEFGRYIPNFTENFISSYTYYDSATHNHLGNYLRTLRDTKGINLMPFYNCYSDMFLSSYRLSKDGYIPQTINSRYKICMIPIKFNTIYTIAIDNSQICYTMPLLLSHDIEIKTYINKQSTILNDLLSRGVNTLTQLSYKKPFKYIVPNDNPVLERYERNLYLIIQLPIDNRSTITILEGDYTNNPKHKIFNRDGILNFSNSTINRLMLSELSLLRLSDTNSYAFSNRLIEYLTLNVINSADEISPNIAEIQNKYTDLVRVHRSTLGVWDNRLRDLLWTKYINSSHMENIDITGNVDRDMEKFLMGGYK